VNHEALATAYQFLRFLDQHQSVCPGGERAGAVTLDVEREQFCVDTLKTTCDI
jgi:hypothetical protein